MSAPITTKFGEAIPPAPRHAITFHLPEWSHLLRLVEKDPTLFQSLTSVYPRMILHQDVKALFGAVLKFLNVPATHATLIFTSPKSVQECIAFATSPARGHGHSSTTGGAQPQEVKKEDLKVHILEVEATKTKLYSLVFPLTAFPIILPFWQNSGTGISTRQAEECLAHISTLRELPSTIPHFPVQEGEAHREIKNRIVTLLERAPVGGDRATKVKEGDVYLVQNGMAAIYQVHKFLLGAHGTKSAFFGFAFHNTLHVFEDFGPEYHLFGLGTNAELEDLETWLAAEKKEGRGVQAIWFEFPSNPSLTVPDLSRLRALADAYGCVLVGDDTIGSFANVDLMGSKGVDILVTSLTKSFSGYADVMGGSAVLNPMGSRYAELKSLFTKNFELDYPALDAKVMASNSRDYLVRSKTLNANTLSLVNFFSDLAAKPNTAINKVFYPTTNPEFLKSFDQVKRPATQEFVPGYGCLFSIEFTTIEKMEVFYGAINLHIGPHLGAPRTLILPYVKGIYGKELEWAKRYELRETMMRVAPGLEDVQLLIKDFQNALAVVDGTA